MATMFWLISAWAFEAPWPLMPTIATFTMSLGAFIPRPSTCRGTIMKPAAAVPTVATNSLRFILDPLWIGSPWHRIVAHVYTCRPGRRDRPAGDAVPADEGLRRAAGQ